MDQEYAELIFNKYRFFPPKELRDDETQSCLAWGIECRNGWKKLLTEFFEELDKLELPEGFMIDQIKEKWGGLRIYTNIWNESINKLITKYERIADVTCENCGHDNAKLRKSNNWLVTLCDKCQEAREAKKK
jgi:hypothetical protein